VNSPLRRTGYTLIEILGAFFIMTIILTLVTGIFVENGRQRAAALAMMRESLSAAAALDHISQDVEGALFLSDSSDGPPDEYAWRFLTEGYGDLGAHSIRFVTQNAPVNNRGLHASGWIEIAYFLEEDDVGELTLWRWVAPRPPNEANTRFPSAGDDGAMRVALDVNEFGLRFLDPEGEWLDEWDSTFQTPLAPLPRAVEVNLRLNREARLGESEEGLETVPGPLHTRRIALPMPPINVQTLLSLAEEGVAGEEGCFTVAQCLAEGDRGWYQEELEDDCGGDDRLCDLLAASETTCWSEIDSSYPGVADRAPETCER
jgi:type II secretory pathway component PulJ